MNVTRLALDSALSGHEIGKCVGDDGFGKASEVVTTEFRQYDLVYLTVKSEASIASLLRDFDWIHADTRITLSERIQRLRFTESELTQHDSYDPKDYSRLVALAVDLCRVSRFYCDTNTQRLGRKVYEQWIANSVNKSLADEVIVRRDSEGRVIGFVTAKVDHVSAEPVLVKVDPMFSGKGHGRALMNKFLTCVARRNPNSVVYAHTQLHNLIAIRFYESFGLRVADYDYVYHVYPHGFVQL
jgi:ribosomal protein S18 acetylase RimI-like enzyme